MVKALLAEAERSIARKEPSARVTLLGPGFDQTFGETAARRSFCFRPGNLAMSAFEGSPAATSRDGSDP
jgi:hypothetical protein